MFPLMHIVQYHASDAISNVTSRDSNNSKQVVWLFLYTVPSSLRWTMNFPWTWSMLQNQNGFHKDRSCMDASFTAKLLMGKYIEHNLELHMCFINLEKAYDNVTREIFQVLRKHNIERKLIRAIEKRVLQWNEHQNQDRRRRIRKYSYLQTKAFDKDIPSPAHCSTIHVTLSTLTEISTFVSILGSIQILGNTM